MNYFVTGVAPKRLGNAHPNICPYQCFPTLDGYIVLTVGNDSQFVRFCSVVGREEWSSDARFSSNPARVTNRDILVPMIAELFLSMPTNEWLALLDKADVPCGPVNTIKDVFADEHVQARGMQVELKHPLSGTVPSVASPMNFSRTPIKYRDPAPLLGQHTDDVLTNLLRLSEEQIKSLKESSII